MRVTFQLHNSSVNCTRELFKPSRDAASFRICSEKKLGGFGFFVYHVINGVCFWPFWLKLPDPGPKALDGSISLKFLLETKLASEAFKLLINFLGFQV